MTLRVIGIGLSHTVNITLITQLTESVGDWFDILGVFDGDWKTERDALVAASMPINWETRKYYGDKDDTSPMLAQEEYDIAASRRRSKSTNANQYGG
jgi:hypothetical protein